ncbi:TrlF family AAA-like ATPase [Gordonia sp. KTR9]|uniref:TrlF family AAA-like ATPase n=1 Tax=Gordonia sp. KTR9 TaxID=337191 RepID=UPI00027DE3B6|nr:AAA family ATPase [Gordonia sp. KTR9]AFR48641.1 hypothetical protein KTR9_2004 [Gordonia sp. KTR9]
MTSLDLSESSAEASDEHGAANLSVTSRGVGGRWWSLDIHAHSPASFDYGGLPDVRSDAPKPTFKEWIRAYSDAGVNGIVVADHNTHEGIEQARAALAELIDEDQRFSTLVIFPGVELTVTGGIHALAIFDPESPAEIVNQTLTLCQYKGTRGASDQTAEVTVGAAAKIVDELGGLFVPAHADKKHGVLKMDSRELASLGESPYIYAVEVIDDDALDLVAPWNWVPLLGSDAHHLTVDSHPDPASAKAPGTHLTLVKAETLNLQGLRLALTDPQESIRRCLKDYDDPNVIDHGHINSLEVSHEGATETYRFGPWMNCLIGGRGVGKSTVLELLRLALGRSSELPQGIAVDLVRFDPQCEPEQQWWGSGTRITVNYTKDGRPLKVTWLGSDPTHSKIELWDGSKWEVQAGRVYDRAPVRVFSQKQIYELASQPQSFLAILDDMPQIRRAEWDEEYEALQLRFKGERNKLRQLLAESEKADRIRGELEEVRGRLRHLEEVKASSEYQELETLETRLRQSVSAEEEAVKIEREARGQATMLRGLTTEFLNVAEYSDRAASLIRAADLMDEASRELSTARSAWEAGTAHQQWQARVTELNTWLSDQGGPSRVAPEQTRLDRQRQAELEKELRSVENSDEHRAQQESVIDEILTLVIDKRRELFERRKAFTNALNYSGGSLTKVEVFHQGDIGRLEGSLRDLLNCPDSFDSAFAKDGIASFLNCHQPKSPGFADHVVNFKEKLVELVEDGVGAQIASGFKVDSRFYNRFANIDTFDLVTDIMLWFPDDLVSVRYRLRDAGNFVPVDRGSPGQKTAALLTVILQMGTDPLLLDQPEDDLENKLIRHLAVQTLKTIKRNRQLIISTHNANVVVTSGSENIIVLQHGDLLPVVEAEGTLQRAAVRENVCEILEGGEDAIKTRYRRLIGSLD